MARTRWYVKIRAHEKYQGLAKSIYFKNEMTFEFLTKWLWFFKYREALYRVKNPRHYIELTHGSYDWIPSGEKATIDLKNKIQGKKATITKYKNLLKKAEENWNELFPITDDHLYKKCVSKIARLEQELAEILKVSSIKYES